MTFFKDTIFPDIEIVIPSQNLTNSTDFNYNVNYTYSETNTDSCWWTDDWGVTNLTLTCGDNLTNIGGWVEGLNQIIISINDSLNNVNSSSIAFTIDATAPSFVDIANVSIYENQSVNFQINSTDAGVGIDCYSVNDTTNFNISCDGILNNITGLSNQIYYLNITVNDTLNNMASNIMWVNVSDVPVVDTIFPNINITYPINNSNYSDNQIPINYTYSDDVSISSCWYSNDTFTTNTTLTCGNNITITWSDGEHDVIVWVNDTSNNVNSSRVNFTIDTIAPTFDNLANQSIYNNQSLSFDIGATDTGVGVECFSVNDTTNFQIDCSGVLTNKTILSIQIYNLNITVNDTLGNTASNIMWVNVSNSTQPPVDTTKPVVSLRTPLNNSIWTTSSSVNFIYNVTDTSAIDNCSLWINGVINGSVDTTITKDINQSFTRTLNNATYVWNVNCTDSFNNIGHSSVYNLSVNVVPAPPISSINISKIYPNEPLTVPHIRLGSNLVFI